MGELDLICDDGGASRERAYCPSRGGARIGAGRPKGVKDSLPRKRRSTDDIAEARRIQQAEKYARTAAWEVRIKEKADKRKAATSTDGPPNAQCKGCGKTFYSKPFISVDKLRKFCPECAYRLRYGNQPDDDWRNPKPCRNCTTVFAPSRPSSVYCSSKCHRKYVARTSARLQSARRRGAYAAGEMVDWLSVMIRDKWQCHLCKRKTKKSLRGKQESLSPELDHIIPIAAGGGHTYDNCACSCHECNAKKNDRIIGQLSLFGNLFVEPKDGLTNRARIYQNMRSRRDIAVMKAIEELAARGQPAFIRNVAELAGVTLISITKALRWKTMGRIKPPWADMIRKMTPKESGDITRRLLGKPKRDIVCRRCNTPFRKAKEGSGTICQDCLAKPKPTKEKLLPQQRQCAACPIIFTPRQNHPKYKFCSAQCQYRDQRSRSSKDIKSHKKGGGRAFTVDRRQRWFAMI